MRVRTDNKRREIIAAAAALFAEQGYERTSMSAISDRIGGSKATLYGYFASKEDLLRAVLEHDVVDEVDRLIRAISDDVVLREGLIRLGVQYLTHRLSDGPIANLRTVANQPAEPPIGKEFYANVLKPAWEQLAGQFRSWMERGQLLDADPWTAAMHWKGLAEAGLFERRLLGAIPAPRPAEINRQATLAADAFLKIYGVEQVLDAEVAA